MNNQPDPIFIVGTPRSGTTLLRLIIDSHLDVAITPESSFLFRKIGLWSSLYPDLSNKQSIQHFINDLRRLPQVKNWLPEQCTADELVKYFPDMDSLAETLNAIYSYYALLKGKKRWGDKTPKNLHAVRQILALFPRAKILIMVRDCRDVAMSLNKAEFSKVSYISAAHRWQHDADITQQLIHEYNDRIYLLKYEGLLESPDTSIKSVLYFFNLANDSKIMQRYLEHQDDVVHTKSTLYRKPLSEVNVYRWKKNMCLSDIARCEAIAQDGLKYFGYQLTTKNSVISPATMLFHKVSDFFQLIVNRKNMQNYSIFIRLSIKATINTAPFKFKV